MRRLHHHSSSLVLTLAVWAGCGNDAPPPPPAPVGSGSSVVGSGGTGSGSGSGSAVAVQPDYVVPVRPRVIGQTRDAIESFKLQGTVTDAGKTRPLLQATRSTWTDKILAVDAELVTKLEVGYKEQRQQVQDKAEATGPLHGRTYTVALDVATKKISVTRKGGKASAEEVSRVTQDFSDDVGAPPALGAILAGTGFTKGQAVSIPAEALTALIAVEGARGRTLTMTLEELTEETARFGLVGEAELGLGASQVAAALKGTLTLARATGWVLALALTAELSAPGTPTFTGSLEGAQAFVYGN